MPKLDIATSRGAALHIISKILMTNQLRTLAYQLIVYHRKVTLYRIVYPSQAIKSLEALLLMRVHRWQ